MGHAISKHTIRTGSGERCDYGEAVDVLLRARQRATARTALSSEPAVEQEQQPSRGVSQTDEPEGDG